MSMRLKPQDVVLALKLVGSQKPSWTQPQLSMALHISVGEVNHGLKRLAVSHLYNAREKRIIRSAFLEFLVSGLRYVFPAQVGLLGEGMPTSVGASVLKEKFLFEDADMVVWPAPEFEKRVPGRVVEPLYKSAPQAAAEDPALHEYLALLDALRVGKARDRTFAKEELTRRLSH